MITLIIISVSILFLIFGLGLIRIFKKEKDENSGIMGIMFLTISTCILIALYLTK